MTDEIRKQTAEYFALPTEKVADWHVERLIEHSLAITTAKDHERDVQDWAGGRGLMTTAQYQVNEGERNAYEESESARIAGEVGIELNTPMPVWETLRLKERLADEYTACDQDIRF